MASWLRRQHTHRRWKAKKKKKSKRSESAQPATEARTSIADPSVPGQCPCNDVHDGMHCPRLLSFATPGTQAADLGVSRHQPPADNYTSLLSAPNEIRSLLDSRQGHKPVLLLMSHGSQLQPFFGCDASHAFFWLGLYDVVDVEVSKREPCAMHALS
jgi:hypothetical protein